MVLRGQYLERAVVIATGDEAAPLEGLYHRGVKRPGVLIVPDHPERGGSMEVPVIAELAWAITRAGHPTLRFNFAGVGASPGRFAEDSAFGGARAARAHLHETVDGPDALVGIGFGARVADALALEAPPELLVLVVAEPAGLCALPARYPFETLIVGPGWDRGQAAEARRIAEALPRGRWALVPGADPAYHRGLVELGKLVAEAIAPPGLISLS